MGYVHLTQDKIDRIIEMSRLGRPVQEIVSETGVSKTSVGKIRRENGFAAYGPDNTKISQDKIDQIVRMGREGATVPDIANAVGVTRATVTDRLRRNGITPIHGKRGLNNYIGDEAVARIIQMTRDGAKTSDIMKAVGCSWDTVVSYQKKHGLYKDGRKNPRPKTVPEPEPVPEVDPMTIPGMKKYHLVIELCDISGVKFTKEMDICETCKRDAIKAAFKAVNIDGYRNHWKVCKSIHQIDANVDVPEPEPAPVEPVTPTTPVEQKVEEKPVKKNSHIKIASTTKTFEIDSTDNSRHYFVSIDGKLVRLELTSKYSDLKGYGIEFNIDGVREFSEELFEILALIEAENNDKGA